MAFSWKWRWRWPSRHARTSAPTIEGLRLERTIQNGPQPIGRIAWSPDGDLIAAPAEKGPTRVFYYKTGEDLEILDVPRVTQGRRPSATFHPSGHALAITSDDGAVSWLMRAVPGDLGALIPLPGARRSVAYSPNGRLLAQYDGSSIALWTISGEHTLGHAPGIPLRLGDLNPTVYDLAFSPSGDFLATCAGNAARLTQVANDLAGWVYTSPHEIGAVGFHRDGRRLVVGLSSGSLEVLDLRSDLKRPEVKIEGHTSGVTSIAFDSTGAIMATMEKSGTTIIWNATSWERITTIPGHGYSSSRTIFPGVAFHPQSPVLAIPAQTADDRYAVQIWRLDPEVIRRHAPAAAVRYKTAKIVLLGESGAGKTGLGWRLSHGEFKEHPSTHGQQFWLLNDLSATRTDGTECEAVLWDLAGQPDYRLIHSLFVDDADVALVVFDPTANEPLRDVEYWLRQLQVGPRRAQPSEAGRAPRVILVAARIDVGPLRIARAAITEFCSRWGIEHYIETSAKLGRGIDELVSGLGSAVDWDSQPQTVTTTAFKQIKDQVLGLKESSQGPPVLSQGELWAALGPDAGARYTEAEVGTAVNHLANHGYVTWLRKENGERWILLKPELLNNLAASIIIQARADRQQLGSVDEQDLFSGRFAFSELDGLSAADRALLVESAIASFLSHNICVREIDPRNRRSYLIFPDLINLPEQRVEEKVPVEDDTSYAVSGPTENLYARLVVLLGYSNSFARTSQWRNQARYVMGESLVCELRVEPDRSDELIFTLSYGVDVQPKDRLQFQLLFESMLADPTLSVQRLPILRCQECGDVLERSMMRRKLAEGRTLAYCVSCGRPIALPQPDAEIGASAQQVAATATDRQVAVDRTALEECIFLVVRLVEQRQLKRPSCFISYAWGNAADERWVERNLVIPLANAGLQVIYDRWDCRPGSILVNFIERVHDADLVMVVGTPDYKRKWESHESMGPFVLRSEAELIGTRMMGNQTATVWPLLLHGTVEESLPKFLQGRVRVDFRDQEKYFSEALDLILHAYGIDLRDPAVVELREQIARTYGG